MREPARLADLPRDERERLAVEKQREIQEGLTRTHVAKAVFARAYLAAQLARLIRMGKG